MKLYLYANRNKLGDFFSGLITEKIEPEELVKSYRQIICNFKDEVLEQLKECELYCLGSIDNVSGEIIPCKEFLLNIADIVEQIKAAKEISNGSEKV